MTTEPKPLTDDELAHFDTMTSNWEPRFVGASVERLGKRIVAELRRTKERLAGLPDGMTGQEACEVVAKLNAEATEAICKLDHAEVRAIRAERERDALKERLAEVEREARAASAGVLSDEERGALKLARLSLKSAAHNLSPEGAQECRDAAAVLDRLLATPATPGEPAPIDMCVGDVVVHKGRTITATGAGSDGKATSWVVGPRPDPVYHDDINPDPLEVAYWRFDSLRAGTAKECRVDATTKAPMAERDAFKRALREMSAAPTTPALRDCTCLGGCRGIEGLSSNWRCAKTGEAGRVTPSTGRTVYIDRAPSGAGVPPAPHVFVVVHAPEVADGNAPGLGGWHSAGGVEAVHAFPDRESVERWLRGPWEPATAEVVRRAWRVVEMAPVADKETP